jgi:excisionase family DNA binding protein
MTIDSNKTELLSVDQLSTLLNISKTSVYRLVSSRSIPFYKIGHNLRFKKDDVINYLENNYIESIS